MSFINKEKSIPLSENFITEQPYPIGLSEQFKKFNNANTIMFNKNNLTQINFQRPTITQLKTTYKPSVSYPILQLKIEAQKKKHTVPMVNEMAIFSKRLYKFKLSAIGGLEKMFAHNSKMISLLNSIKTQYE